MVAGRASALPLPHAAHVYVHKPVVWIDANPANTDRKRKPVQGGDIHSRDSDVSGVPVYML